MSSKVSSFKIFISLTSEYVEDVEILFMNNRDFF